MDISDKKKSYIFCLKAINIEKIDQKYGITFVSNISNSNTDPPVNTTKITDLSNDKKTPDIVSFLDESKRLHKCCVTMIDFNSKTDIRSLDYNCFWDRHPFSTTPIGCPTKYIASQAVKVYYSEISRDTYIIKENITPDRQELISGDSRLTIEKNEYYETDGIFCSFNCCQAFIKDNKHKIIYNQSETLLTEIYNHLFGDSISVIESAPHWRLIKEYGGHHTIDTFRESFNKIEYEPHGKSGNVSNISSGLKDGKITYVHFRPTAMLFEEHIKL